MRFSEHLHAVQVFVAKNPQQLIGAPGHQCPLLVPLLCAKMRYPFFGLFDNRPRFRRLERGDVAGEDLYSAMGQIEDGRYLIVFFIYKRSREALIISARDMSAKERRSYGNK